MSEAFEDIVAVLLEADGYWVKRNVKIQIPSAQVVTLGLRNGACELDLVALRLKEPQEVLVVECKSFGRSGGVDWKTFAPPTPPVTRKHRYRLFWDYAFQASITGLLNTNGVTPSLPHVYCLASAATQASSHAQIQAHLHARGMRLFDRAWLMQRLAAHGVSPVNENCTVSALATIFHPSSSRYA